MLEDDPVLSELVSQYLAKHFVVDSVATFDEALDYLDQFHYDITLLDRNIDGNDIGMDLIDKIKSKNPRTGIIIISAYDSIAEKVKGLNLGADDYLDKPFDNEELLARIIALSRRNQGMETMEIEGIHVDLSNKSLFYEDEEIVFSKKESDLLFYLLSKRGTIVSKDTLLDAIYLNPQNISSNTIDVTIKNIRKKLPVNIIQTVKTRGYLVP